MVRWLREWWDGKDVRVDPTAADTTGGMGNLHEYRNEKHWTSEAAHRFVAWHSNNWSPLWTLAISVLSLLVSFASLLVAYAALSRSG